MIWVIARREFRSLFQTPLAWVVLAVIQLTVAALFFKLLSGFVIELNNGFSVDDMPGLTESVFAPLLGYLAIVLLFATPMIMSRVLSEERRQKTLVLLLAAPVTMSEIVLGKFFGSLAFFLIVIILVLLLSAALLLGGTLDYGHVIACIFAITILAMTFTAIGLFASALTQHPTLAGLLSFFILWILWVSDWSVDSLKIQGILDYLQMSQHYVNLLKGNFQTQDFFYFVLVTILFLGLTIWRMDYERLQH